MVRTRGTVEFNLDGGDAALVETAVEITLANWFSAPEPLDYHVRSGASSVVNSRRLETGRRLQTSLLWSASWDVFVYEQQMSAATAIVQDLRNNAASVESFAAALLVELEKLGIGAGFSGFAFTSLTDPFQVSISQVSSTTTSSTSSTTTVTSTTSSTSSSSTSSSTSTTLFPLLMEGAELTQGYSTLLVTFNERAMLTEDLPARRLQEVGVTDMVDCGKVFTVATMNLLGAFPTCTWLADGRNLQVTLGTSPTVTLSDSVETLDGALTTNRAVVDLPVTYTPSLTTPVFTNDPPAQPQAALLASPLKVQACSAISVSAATSSGAAARPFVVSWSLGSSTHYELAQALQAKLASATGPTLAISQLELFTAVEAVKGRMGSNFFATQFQLEFQVSITNWLGRSDQATVVVDLENSEEPMPIVTPTSAVSTTIYNSDPVAFSVQTLYADTSSCSNTNSTPQQIVVTWEYSENFGAYQAFPVSLKDLDRSPGGIRFNGYTFQSNTFHQFRVTAQYEGASSAGARQYVFNLTVAPPAPPVVRIIGPSSVSDACSFSLDASGSYDPSLQPGTAADLAFEWSCVSSTGSDCALSNFATPTATDGSGTAGAQITVAGGELAEGFYNFTVSVRRTGETEATVSLWQLEISAGALPPVSIAVPWSEGEAVSTQMGWRLGPTIATVQGSQGCTVPTSWAWKFVLVEDNSQSSILAFMSTSISGSGSLTLSTSEFLDRFLIPGNRYYYAILQAANQAEMDILEAGPLDDLGRAMALGAKVVKSAAFLADGPPSGGIVQSSPQAGYAVTNSFSGTTFAWYDEDVSTLSYAFYLLPFRQNLTMTSDGNGGIVLDGQFQNPVVDWSNVSSPLYWSRQGGSFLKNVSDPNAAQWDVSVGVGAYVMAAVARDRFGAMTAAYTPGPLVEAPPGGVSPELAANLLDTALSSGDETVILGALGSLTSVPVASADAAQAEAVTTKKLEALDAAAGVVGASSASLTMFGDVANNLLQSESGGASANVAEQASGALDTVLTAALDSEGIDAGAGESLLRATTSVGDSFATSSSDSDVAKGARASKLRVLFSKLGSALLQQMPAGASSSVSTVEGGKGTEIAVVKEDLSAAQESGVSSDGAQIPASALARRLQSGCTSLAVQNTNFVGSNPFNYLTRSLGKNAYVANDATVRTLELKQCDTSLVRPNLDPPIALKLQLNAVPGLAPEGYVYEPVCVRLDETSELLPQQEWTVDSMTWLLPSSYGATELECLAGTGGGSYAAIYVPVKLETTLTSTSMTSTRTLVTTVTSVPVEVQFTDGGMVFGVVLAGIALVVVAGAIGWQCYVGNVKVQKPEMPRELLKQVSDQWQGMKEKMQWKSARVGTEPTGPGTERKEAWPENPQPKPQAERKQARSDAQDHFWDWANDLIKSTSQGDAPTPPHTKSSGQSFALGPPKVGSPPTLPPRFSVRRPSVEKEEYFQSFAQELREMVSSGIPGLIADSPVDVIPPSPPPKRSVQSNFPALPPAPPPRPRRDTSSAVSTVPPQLANAERVAVRVDQAYSDWMNDFASVAALAPSARESPDSPPPPPPRPPLQSMLPGPPPRPAIANQAAELKAPPPLNRGGSSSLSELRNFAKAPPLPAAALAGTLPLPPPPPRSDSQMSVLSPPSLKAGSQLSRALPKHQPLHPPLPKGASVRSTSSATGAPPIPGAISGEGSHTPREHHSR